MLSSVLASPASVSVKPTTNGRMVVHMRCSPSTAGVHPGVQSKSVAKSSTAQRWRMWAKRGPATHSSKHAGSSQSTRPSPSLSTPSSQCAAPQAPAPSASACAAKSKSPPARGPCLSRRTLVARRTAWRHHVGARDGNKWRRWGGGSSAPSAPQAFVWSSSASAFHDGPHGSRAVRFSASQALTMRRACAALGRLPPHHGTSSRL